MIRPSEERMLLQMALVAATRGTCTRLHVGAVLARDGRVLATGRNGAASGLPHCLHIDDEPCRWSVHAEANAVAFAARHGVPAAGATLYATHAPCAGCAGLIINAGIVAVVYLDAYRDTAGVEALRAAGVAVHQHTREEDGCLT